MAELKDRIVHEEELIHRRLGWMLAFQGFLFASYSKVFSGSLTLDAQLAIVLPAVGLASALLTLSGIAGAYISIGAERNKQQAHQPSAPASQVTDFGAGGWAKYLGRLNAFGLPVILSSAWLYLLWF
ncbi:hypothetical protein [Pseudoalteromonas sp. MMG022]|uniref:hypothetical protein n=1 Tax=Pseudoalteromonas sp. MMG022 TaxID=2909978 RepID=UPI001F41437D|nr:hypothetical protein [Pseudoalteromonas sp. MMG022]MCF6435361.1 hypothetical protein [Pseudoalteromonas sp. MMG022]